MPWKSSAFILAMTGGASDTTVAGLHISMLALGMIILLVIEARDVGLLPGQWVALIVTTALDAPIPGTKLAVRGEEPVAAADDAAVEGGAEE